MAGRGDDAEPEALQVVERARGEVELVLAAVAGAGVDVARASDAARGCAASASSRRRR